VERAGKRRAGLGSWWGAKQAGPGCSEWGSICGATKKLFCQQLSVNFSLSTVIEHSKESLAREKILNGATILKQSREYLKWNSQVVVDNPCTVSERSQEIHHYLELLRKLDVHLELLRNYLRIT
jgi:hypothetical protein